MDLKKGLVFDKIEIEKDIVERRREFYARLNRELFAYEKSISIFKEKMIGKVITSTKVGQLGTILVSNKGISKNTITTLLETKQHSFHENIITSKINKKQNDFNTFEENSSDDEL